MVKRSLTFDLIWGLLCYFPPVIICHFYRHDLTPLSLVPRLDLCIV